MAKYLTLSGLNILWTKIKGTFVAKETGKVLSSNDYTTTEKNKLKGIAEGAQVNVIEAVKVGDSNLAVSSKTVTLGKVSTKDEITLAELSLALQQTISGKVDAATTLAGYGITDAMTASEIASAISTAVAGADHMKRKTVTSTSDIDTSASDASQYIYMVKNSSGQSGNLYDEYMVIDGKLEKVGDWEVDLSEYAKSADIVEITEDEINTICV